MPIILLLFIFLTDSATAQNGCMADHTGKVYCAPAGGSAAETVKGIACAPGTCSVDNQGYLKCSAALGGGATTDNAGRVVCLGGCISPSKNYCIEARGDKK